MRGRGYAGQPRARPYAALSGRPSGRRRHAGRAKSASSALRERCRSRTSAEHAHASPIPTMPSLPRCAAREPRPTSNPWPSSVMRTSIDARRMRTLISTVDAPECSARWRATPDRAVHRDPLPRGQRLRVAADLELRLDPVRSVNASTSRWRISPSGRVMMLRDSSERESSRSCRSSSVTRARTSSNRPAARSRCESRMNGQTWSRSRATSAPERQHVLDGAVVEVEADPHQPLLAGADEDPLALGRPLEEKLAFVDRRHGRGGHREVGVCLRHRLGNPSDDRRDR